MSEKKNNDRCPCGKIILADTEDWDTPLCYSCFMFALGQSKNYTELLTEARKLRDEMKRVMTASNHQYVNTIVSSALSNFDAKYPTEEK